MEVGRDRGQVWGSPRDSDTRWQAIEWGHREGNGRVEDSEPRVG
jgi:hypothetical protein